MADTPAPQTGGEPAVLFTLPIEIGSEVKVRRPGAGERGIWRVTGLAATPNAKDPAYDVTHTSSGRRRVFRASRLLIVRPARGTRGRR